jgi:hypothetical protein
MKKILFLTLIIALTFTACPPPGPGPEPEPAHVHQWGAWTTTTPATCSATGTQTRTCTLDATHTETRDISIDPTAHDWGDWVETTPATNTTEGVKTRTCKLNPTHKETNTIPLKEKETLTGSTSISGNAVVGQTLTANFTGTNDITYGANTYQWTRAQGAAAPANINGATSQTYVVAAGDVGYTLGVNVGNTATVGTVSSGRTGAVQEARADRGPQQVGGFTFTGNQITVRGVNLTAAEWSSVLTQLPLIINARYAAAIEGGAVRERYENVFARAVTITIEKTSDYDNWKTDATGFALRLNINKISDWSSIMNAAVRAVDEFTATQARVLPGRDTLRMAQGAMGARGSRSAEAAV